MVEIREIVNQFLVAYTMNKLESIKERLSENIELDYTNIAPVKGREAALSALKWEQDFDVKRVTTTNRIEYVNHTYVIGLIAHHLVSYEKSNEMFPLVFGGKYIFIVNKISKLIEKISFVLEYQAENTVYVKNGWKLSNGHNNYLCCKTFNTEYIYQTAVVNKDIWTLTNLFFWCLDTQDFVSLEKLVAANFTIARDQSVGHTRFEANLATLPAYVEETNRYYDLNQHSIRINSIEDGIVITVYAQHLTPHRLGTKKLNSMTKYHSFFDEDITVTFAKDSLKIQSVDLNKVADVYYNGFEILEY